MGWELRSKMYEFQNPYDAIPSHVRENASKQLVAKSMGSALWNIRGVACTYLNIDMLEHIYQSMF